MGTVLLRELGGRAGAQDGSVTDVLSRWRPHAVCLPAVRCMMYGFGDDQNPYTESVDILEDLVIEFITEMVSQL